MRLSTSLGIVGKPEQLPVEQAVRTLAAASFDALDVPFCDLMFPGSPFSADDWRQWLAGVRGLADGLGVRFTQGHGPWGVLVDHNDPDQRATMLAVSRKALQGGAILGVKWMVFHPIFWDGSFDREHHRSMRQFNLDLFGELLQTARQSGIGIAIENTADNIFERRGLARAYGCTPAELVDLADTLDDPLVGLCLDTGHAHVQKLNLSSAVEALGSRLKALHVQDNNGRIDQHLLPFSGTIDWSDFMYALRVNEYAGDFTFEAENSVRTLPTSLHEDALRFAVAIGEHLLLLA
jgi:sugar phosphate isomerase/epimerase